MNECKEDGLNIVNDQCKSIELTSAPLIPHDIDLRLMVKYEPLERYLSKVRCDSFFIISLYAENVVDKN